MTNHKWRFLWLDQLQDGKRAEDIARRYMVTVALVLDSVAEARAQLSAFAEARRLMTPPPLEMLFPLNGLFPVSRCNHGTEPIPEGSHLCCAVCHQYGHDDHPSLDRFPAVEPRRDPVIPRPVPVRVTRREQRQQRRRGRVA
jgi:hypothetical protein